MDLKEYEYSDLGVVCDADTAYLFLQLQSSSAASTVVIVE